MSRRSSDQHEEPWHANGPSSRGIKRPSVGDDNRTAKPAPSWGGAATSDVTVGFMCAGPLQQDPFICPPPASRPSPVGLVMRPGPDSDYDPQGAPKPSNEEFRVNVLRSYNILDTEPEPRYDRLTALASMIFHTPVALVSLVDEHRQWFKSNLGLPGCPQTERESSFCAFALLPSVDPCLVVYDALKDGRFCKNPLVIGEPHIRFYAGAPLVTQGNFVLGSLCIIDFEPRATFSAEEQEMLLSLAQLVVLEIEKHTRALELQRLQVERFEEDKRGLLQAIDAFSEGLVLCDVSQEGQPIVFVNEGWEVITGYSIQDVLGLHCGSLLEGPLTDIKAKQLIAKACREGSSASVEILNYRKDGTPFWNWLRIRPVVFPKGTSFGGDGQAEISSRYYFGILSDCTLRKDKELELEAIRLQELEAEALVRAKRSFVANISHEIRTPMNAILACSQLLTDMASLTDEQRELSQMIQGSGQQLLSLINDILDFSKMDAGKMELKASEFNLWGCLDFCMEMLVLKCENKGLYLSYNMDESVPDWIWADEVRLRQILTNLLSNSAKFTDEGGEVEVSVSAKRVRRQLSKEGFDSPLSPRGGAAFGAVFDESGELPEYRITIAVRDTGIGIPVTFQKMLFEAFTQCDNSRTRRYEGTGLGLAISKDLAERMGGKMWVESEEGVGSTFFVTITARGSMQQSTGRSLLPGEILHRPPTPIVGKKALLVGTRGAFHRMVGSMLRAWGLDVFVAASVDELDALASGCGMDASDSETNDPSSSGARERVRANQEAVSAGRHGVRDEISAIREGVSATREAISTHHEAVSANRDGLRDGVSATREGVSANGWGSRLERLDVEQGRSFDLFVVDSPVAGRVLDTRKLESVVAENREAIELMHRACALGRGILTVLLTSKHMRNVFQFDMEAMEHVICVSQPVRINPFYTTLLQTLANESPAAPLTSPSALPANGTPPPCDVSLRVFVVEDNLVNQKVLHKVLKSLGYDDIRTACNGLEVLQLLKEHPADVVLMDVQMPEMDGLTATARIKADFPEDRQPMIIALTADVGNDIEKECREAGMISYLSKPVRKAQLERLLLKCVYYKQHPAQRRMLKWIDGL